MKQKQSGFTIIELMISTTIFSLILMLCLAGILQITKMYYGGITQSRTREAARTIVDEIAEAIRFTNQDIQLTDSSILGPQVALGDNAGGYFCIGLKRYTYAIDRQMKADPAPDTKQIRHALWEDEVDQLTGCMPPLPNPEEFLNQEVPSANGKDLLSENMRIFEMSIQDYDPARRTYQVSIGVAYGDDDLLSPRPEETPTELTCEGAFLGVEFCATTNFLVTVQKRL